MNDKSIHKILKRFIKRRPFKQVKTKEEADLFLIFTPDEIEKFTIKLKKDKDVSGITSLPNHKIFYFKSTNPRDASLTSLGFVKQISRT